VNHKLNAKIHRYAACPECDAAESQPCKTDRGFVCAPHTVRLRIHASELVCMTPHDFALAIERAVLTEQAQRVPSARAARIKNAALTEVAHALVRAPASKRNRPRRKRP
jgi:hypothetical protein